MKKHDAGRLSGMDISAQNLDFRQLNEQVKNSNDEVLIINNCCGQRFIGTGAKDKNIIINGTPGNALGAYLNGAVIEVNGNVQDSVGDTMNDGKIIIHGNAGDALGYAMRGGSIFVEGNAGYRTGIHMKEYEGKRPAIIIGGSVGSFLGEYLAGGIIIVLGLEKTAELIGNFTGTGMHGGYIYIRTSSKLQGLPSQVMAEVADKEDLQRIEPYLLEFESCFGVCAKDLMNDTFYVLKPNAKNPYKRLYTAN